MTIKKEEVNQGIILSTQPYKESDALITVYFKDYGKITLIAKGIKKLKSKNAGAVQSLTLSEITFIPRKGLSLLLKASSLDYYRHIKEDIFLEAYATYFLEFVLKNEEDNAPDTFVFEYLKLSLDALNQGYSYKLVYVLYNAFILKKCGSPLQVDECVRCSRKDHIVAISLQDGGFICETCLSSYDKRLDKKILMAFRHINKYSILDIDKIHIEENILDELIEIMDHYVDEFTGLLLKSKKFIKQLKKL
ncbi:MAG: DNA repair protein RecO [Faecalibacillus sp.]